MKINDVLYDPIENEIYLFCSKSAFSACRGGYGITYRNGEKVTKYLGYFMQHLILVGNLED